MTERFIHQTRVKEAMAEALDIATHSPDASTQNGASIILANYRGTVSGYNHFPRRVLQTDERWERPAKYKYVEHAERDAIYHAAYLGKALMDATMVCPWAACSDCARGIVQSGIRELVRFPLDEEENHWNEEVSIGDTIMREAGVKITEVQFDLEIPPLLRNGKIWTP